MNLVITDRSNSSSNWPFGLFLSEQICSRQLHLLGEHEVCTLASMRFAAMPADMVRSVRASTCARNCVTT